MMFDLYIIPEDCVIVNDRYVIYIEPEIQFALALGFEEWGDLETTQSMNMIYELLYSHTKIEVNSESKISSDTDILPIDQKCIFHPIHV